MKYKPDEATLISYMYGELEKEEANKVMVYLNAHPEIINEWKGLEDSREIIQHIPEVKTNPPAIDFSFLPPENKIATKVKTMLPMWLKVLAACLAIIVTLGLTGFQVSWDEQSITLAFGKKISQKTISPNSIDREESLNQALAANRDSLDAGMKRMEMRFTQQIQNLETQSEKNQKTTSRIAQVEAQKIQSQILSETEKRIAKLMEYSATYQEEKTEKLLVEFSTYLQQQRQQDLEMIGSTLTEIISRSDLQQKETEILLSHFITELQTKPTTNK